MRPALSRQHTGQRQRSDGSGPWGKHSFVAAAARNRPPHPEERKKKRCDLTQKRSSSLLSPPAKRRKVSFSLQGEVYWWTLSARILNWCACAAHPWFLNTILRGYRLQFAMKPPKFNGIIASVAEGESSSWRDRHSFK